MRIFARFAYQRAFLDRGIAALSNVPSCRNASFMFVYMASLKHHAQNRRSASRPRSISISNARFSNPLGASMPWKSNCCRSSRRRLRMGNVASWATKSRQHASNADTILFTDSLRCDPSIVQVGSYDLDLRAQFGDVVSAPACAAISEAASNVVFRFTLNAGERGLLASPRIVKGRLRNMGASVDDSVHVDDNFFLFARLYTVQRGFQNLSVVLYVAATRAVVRN